MKFKLFAKTRDQRILIDLVKTLLIFIFLAAALIVIYEFLPADSSAPDGGGSADAEKSDCNVIGIELHGNVVTYISPSDFDTEGNLIVDETASENIIYNINEAEKDDKIKAIILEVDSYGGSPVAGEEISIAFKNAKKPTVAHIRTAAASAAYWAATGVQLIFASQNSDVGGIGVTMSYVENAEKNKQEGLSYIELASAKFKDAGDPDRPLTAEEKKLFQRDLDILHNNFVKAVAASRNLPVERVRKMADGSTMLGQMALANKLIDRIGNFPEVNEYLKELIGEEPEICW